MELFHSAALLFQIPRCRVVDQPALLCKTGAVAGAIPRVLLRVPFQRAAEMGTTLGGRGQKVDHGLEAIDHQLGGRRPQLPQRDGEDTLHHRPVQGEERGAGDGDTAVTGDSG